MTLQQLSALKHWQVAHRFDCPIEFHTWDAMLTLWVIGWMGAPSALILWQPLDMALCLVFFFSPSLYVWWRLRLHEQRRVRCDWLHVVRNHMQVRRHG